LKISDKNNLEAILVNAIEEVRKNILKRRLRQEVLINNRSKSMSSNQRLEEDSKEARTFEDSVMKLVQYSRGRVKFEDFTSSDKFHMMELFVTNESILTLIY